MSSPTTAFEKSLRSFQTGGLTYSDFLGDLKQMLATGASSTELQEILARRQAIEPMSDALYAEVAGVLNDAALATAAVTAAPPAEAVAPDAQSPSVEVTSKEAPAGVKGVRNAAVTPVPGGRPRPTGRTPTAGAVPQLFSIASVPVDAADAGAAARAAELAAARSALEMAQNKTREITELARLRITEATQDIERVRNEAAQLRQSLAERDLELAALQREQSSIRPALATLKDDHAKVLKQKSSLSAELEIARRALEDQRSKGAEGSAALTQKLGVVEAARVSDRAAHEATLATVQDEKSKAVTRSAALAAELETVRRALEDQRSKGAEGSAALTEKLGAVEAARDAERAAHAAALASLREDKAKAVTHGVSLAAELETARRELEDLRSKGAAALTEKFGAIEAVRDEEREAERAAHKTELAGLRDEAAEALTLSSSLTAELAAARRAFEDQRSRVTEAATLAKKLAAAEAARTDAVTALRSAEQQLRTADQQLRAAEHHQGDARQLRESLAAREVELAALRQEHTESARAQTDAIEAQLKASQETAAQSVLDLKKREAALGTAGSELAALQVQSNAYLESLRNREWRQGYEQSLDTTASGATPARIGASSNQPGRMQRAALVAAVLLALIVVGWAIARHKPAATVASARATPAVTVGSVIQDCATCPTVTVLGAGRFKQGAAPGDAGYSTLEGPQHWVVFARPFGLSTNSITVDQFAQFVEATGRDMQGCETYDGAWKPHPDGSWKNPGFTQGGNHPVTCVSFNDATAYAQWLSAKTGHVYRLPSASEWEYAARAGGVAVQPWTNAVDACAHANVADASAAHRYPGWRVFACDDGFVNTSPVGSFKTNAFGLNDMLGNVFQWTEDCWNGDYMDAPIDGTARSSGDCHARELRGGSWFSTPKFVRATYRNQFATDYRTSSVGIRLVREL